MCPAECDGPSTEHDRVRERCLAEEVCALTSVGVVLSCVVLRCSVLFCTLGVLTMRIGEFNLALVCTQSSCYRHQHAILLSVLGNAFIFLPYLACHDVCCSTIVLLLLAILPHILLSVALFSIQSPYRTFFFSHDQC